MESIELLPHHITEVYRRLALTSHYLQERDAAYRKKYGDEFVSFVDSLMERILSEPELRITIVDGIDTICKQCKKQSRCEWRTSFESDDGYATEYSMDEHDILTKWPIFELGKTYHSQEFIQKIRHFTKLEPNI